MGGSDKFLVHAYTRSSVLDRRGEACDTLRGGGVLYSGALEALEGARQFS
jgi:hypothetical protein